MTSIRASIACGIAFVGAFSTHTASSETGNASASLSVRIPVVGCESDGQLGHMDAPQGGEREVHVGAAMANRLALYEAKEGSRMLGPRGWHCFGLYGSNGTVLFVARDPFVMNESLEPVQAGAVGFAGPAIQATARYAGTSGRVDVAQLIARLFPARHAFLQGWSEGDLPRGPYPKDRLFRRSSRVVEYETPARSQGMGTDTYLLPNDAPIRGAAVVQGTDEEPDTMVVAVRLPQALRDLVPTILRYVERATTVEP